MRLSVKVRGLNDIQGESEIYTYSMKNERERKKEEERDGGA